MERAVRSQKVRFWYRSSGFISNQSPNRHTTSTSKKHHQRITCTQTNQVKHPTNPPTMCRRTCSRCSCGASDPATMRAVGIGGGAFVVMILLIVLLSTVSSSSNTTAAAKKAEEEKKLQEQELEMVRRFEEQEANLRRAEEGNGGVAGADDVAGTDGTGGAVGNGGVELAYPWERDDIAVPPPAYRS
ncbi:hypothetical protein BJ508DRAFT_364595 [Ascobolus immersus RN42]|uniref:Uncharacterized protein n=1 Tax=Ascobolus immersus RN42 TaxID=1160509 RepID=A0A3N4HZA8_ASCIM|nr:hypothetical protein BJ508DRAFT_364595 [Ascobolus immersus RN42]